MKRVSERWRSLAQNACKHKKMKPKVLLEMLFFNCYFYKRLVSVAFTVISFLRNVVLQLFLSTKHGHSLASA